MVQNAFDAILPNSEDTFTALGAVLTITEKANSKELLEQLFLKFSTNICMSDLATMLVANLLLDGLLQRIHDFAVYCGVISASN